MESGVSSVVAIAICLTLPACTSDHLYREPLAGPIRLGGRTAIKPSSALRTPGLDRRLCFALPDGYDVDFHSREIIAANGDRGTLSARLRTDSGAWYSLTMVSKVSTDTDNVCLQSVELVGRKALSFVEIEVESRLAWESPQGYWVSAEKL